MVVLNRKLEQWWYSTEEKLEQWWYSTEEKLEQWWYSTQDETRAMVVLNRMKHRDDTRDNQTCVKSGLRPRIRRGSSGYRKNGSGCWPQPRPPTDL